MLKLQKHQLPLHKFRSLIVETEQGKQWLVKRAGEGNFWGLMVLTDEEFQSLQKQVQKESDRRALNDK